MSMTEKYSKQELQEMQKYCVYIRNCLGKTVVGWEYPQVIHEIALVEINRELNKRETEKENRP